MHEGYRQLPDHQDQRGDGRQGTPGRLKPVAFEIAGREAFKLAFRDAGPVLREPIMNVRIVVPEANMGDIMGDLNTRRARQGMNSERAARSSLRMCRSRRCCATTDLRP
jgi:elongation factor G